MAARVYKRASDQRRFWFLVCADGHASGCGETLEGRIRFKATTLSLGPRPFPRMRKNLKRGRRKGKERVWQTE